MVWQIEFEKKADKQFGSLDFPIQKKIVRYLRERIADDPKIFGKELTGDRAGLWRYRIEDYRVICKLQDARLVVLVMDVGHRKEIYK
jgi:mRNA interferase RelE/StbE